MANYVIPPRSKPSDYDKYARAQDELIALQIANDANIANARKQVNLGMPAQLTPQETKSAAELLADVGQQEATARLNLEKIGFRPQESSDIIATIRRDPAIDFSMLNANFPSIEADLKRRFNVKLLTSAFFIEYFKKYSDDLAGAVGMKVFAPNNGQNANALINNVTEIRRLMPDPAVIQFLERAARNAGLRDATVLDRLNTLQAALPTQQQLDNLSRLDPVTQQQMINDILLQTQNLPSASSIMQLRKMVEDNSISTSTLVRRIEDIANAVAPGMTNLVAQAVGTPSGKAPGTPGTPSVTAVAIPDFTGPKPPTFDVIKSYLKANNLTTQIKDNNTGQLIPLSQVSSTGKTAGTIPWSETNIQELIENYETQKGNQKMGSGIRFNATKTKRIEPKIKMKIGRGIAVKQQPTYREFGKYAIHIPQLENNDLLNVKYRSLGPCPKFKAVAVSDIFRDFLLDVLETGKVNSRIYSQIEPKERKLFEEISIGAGVWSGFGLQRTTTSEEEEETKRFELLRGEYIAGNNNPKVIQELRKLVIKFMSDGRLRKSVGLNLLMELSS